MIGQPTDKWYKDKSTDKIGVEVNGTRWVIWEDTLGTLGGGWQVTMAREKGQWPFNKKHVTPYGSLPASFQAAAPKWRQKFGAATHIYRPVRASAEHYGG